MKEKRKLKRRPLLFYLPVTFRNTDEIVGHLVDITHEGMMLTSRNEIEKNEPFPFVIALPEPIQNHTELSITAECRWAKPDQQPGYLALGFEFVSLTDEDRLLISRLIMDFRMQD